MLFIQFIIFNSITSCSKSDFIDENNNPVVLNISLEKIETEILENSNMNKEASTSIQPRRVEIPINKDLSAYLTLEDENVSSKNNIKNKLATTNKETQIIDKGVKYGILVYDGDNLINNGHKIFTAGLEYDTEGFALLSGKTYTFIGYSLNSSELPSVSNEKKLSSAKINDVSGDLLYYRHIQSFERGVNALKVTLRHKFTLITTELKVGTTFKGRIQEVRDANFNNISQRANIQLADSAITYSSDEKFELINFDNIPNDGIQTLSSSSNILIARSGSDKVTIAIPSIRVNGKTSSIPATKFNFQSGKKYKLTLTFDVPCSNTSTTGLVSVDSDVNLPNPLLGSLKIEKPKANNPAIFNLALVDNSFNMTINGKAIFTRQYRTASREKINNVWGAWNESETWTTNVPADMEGQYTDGQLVNSMQFDSSNTDDRWGKKRNNSIFTIKNDEIWSIKGNESSPTIRVSINANGVVTVQGRKTSDDNSLYNLYLRPDFTLPTTNNSDRNGAWFQKAVSNNGNTETVISRIRFNKNNTVWNESGSNTILFGFEQSSKPTIGKVHISGTTVFNNVTCN